MITFLPSFVLGCYVFCLAFHRFISITAFQLPRPVAALIWQTFLFCFPSWMLTSSLLLLGPFFFLFFFLFLTELSPIERVGAKQEPAENFFAKCSVVDKSLILVHPPTPPRSPSQLITMSSPSLFISARCLFIG